MSGGDGGNFGRKSAQGTGEPPQPPRWRSRLDPNVRTVLNDPIHWDALRLPYRGCSKADPTQLGRCRKHKRIEAECLLSLPLNSSFLDCGSHFGDTVLTMAIHARENGRHDLRFFAFEPSRRKCKFISDMVRANRLENSVKVLNCCVGDECRAAVSRIPEKGFDRYDGRVAYRPSDSFVGGGGGPAVDSLDTTDSVSPPPCRYYFEGNLHASNYESSSSESSDDSSSDDEDEVIDSKEKPPIPMVSLDSLKDDILPLGFLHLDVEGWEARALRGARDILSNTRGTDCYVVCEVWGEKDCRRRREACMDLVHETPDEDVETAMKEHPHFERLDDIVDGERNLFYGCCTSTELS